MRFIIFSCGYNCEKYVFRNVASVMQQTYRNFTHVIIDDASTDNTWKEIQKQKNTGIVSIRNDVNKKWIQNAVDYFDKSSLDDNDVIVLLDLDDLLLTPLALQTVYETYKKTDCWMTYSRMLYESTGQTSHWIFPYSKEKLEKKLFRGTLWAFTHLRTFKYFLWKELDKEDLKGPDGKYAKYSYDRFVLYPMLEMSSPNHIQFIPDVLYMYNDRNPLQVEKIHREEQEMLCRFADSKKKYNGLIR